MNPQMWLSLVLAAGQILVTVIMVPAVKSLVNLATRVVVLEKGKEVSDRDDSKTAGEIHELRSEVTDLKVHVGELKGSISSLAALVGANIGEKK